MIKVEVLCGSVEDCIVAQECGADRIELNNGTMLGGLTPSLATLILARQRVTLPIVTMVRPRSGGFCYDALEFEQMCLDAALLLEHGADGIVFGCLNEDRSINVEQTRLLIEIAKLKGKEAIFHRAFDSTSDPYQAIETLIELGIDRILTSGLKETAIEGSKLLRDLIEKYGDRIEILPGSGITHDNVLEVLEKTGAKQVHGSFKEWVSDPTTHLVSSNVQNAKDYFIVQEEYLKAVLNIL